MTAADSRCSLAGSSRRRGRLRKKRKRQQGNRRALRCGAAGQLRQGGGRAAVAWKAGACGALLAQLSALRAGAGVQRSKQRAARTFRGCAWGLPRARAATPPVVRPLQRMRGAAAAQPAACHLLFVAAAAEDGGGGEAWRQKRSCPQGSTVVPLGWSWRRLRCSLFAAKAANLSARAASAACIADEGRRRERWRGEGESGTRPRVWG